MRDPHPNRDTASHCHTIAHCDPTADCHAIAHRNSNTDTGSFANGDARPAFSNAHAHPAACIYKTPNAGHAR